ncbi:MAG: hypothetical protein RLZZ338_3757 [Cyanobacteriota bacterium]|jgi:hypothetical protein
MRRIVYRSIYAPADAEMFYTYPENHVNRRQDACATIELWEMSSVPSQGNFPINPI